MALKTCISLPAGCPSFSHFAKRVGDENDLPLETRVASGFRKKTQTGYGLESQRSRKPSVGTRHYRLLLASFCSVPRSQVTSHKRGSGHVAVKRSDRPVSFVRSHGCPCPCGGPAGLLRDYPQGD